MTVPRLLVCDDTPAKRYVLSRWLRRSGFEVVESATASDAAAVLQDGRIDLALLDVHLPDASGLDITRGIRADPALASTPVIHVSAVARDTADKVTALDEGADAYLVDPIDPEELISTVRALLRSSSGRRSAELQVNRLAHLNQAALRLNAAGSVPRLADTSARAAAAVFNTPAIAVLLDEQGPAWRGAAGVSEQPPVAEPMPAEGAAEQMRLIGPGATTLGAESIWPGRLSPAAGPWTAHAVQIGGTIEGFVAVPSGGEDDHHHVVLLLQRLAQAVAVALENLRALAFEHHVALTLQRSLLPRVLPEPYGLRVAARYQASQRRVEVGGDFFDVFEVDRRCFLVIGDVQGHSLEAGVVMAELRYSLRAYAYEGHDVSALIDRLDTLLARGGSDLIATACIIVVDPDRRRIEAVSAGHPRPLLVRAGAATALPVDGPLLGVQVPDSRPTVHHDLAPGDRLLLYTDGLVERRDENLDVSLDRLARQATATCEDAEQLADSLLGSWGDSDDDVALLVVDVLG